MTMRRLLILALLIWPSTVLGQTPVTVTGTITDAGNNPATSGYVQFETNAMKNSQSFMI